MAAPEISELALKTVDIDPYIEYTYALPVRGETSTGVIADANFDLLMQRRMLTLKYTGPFLSELTEFPITLFASNGEETTEFVVTFRVRAYTEIQTNLEHTVTATSGSANIAFGSTIGNYLRVGDIVYLRQNNGSGGTFDNVTRYVVSVSGSNFQLSATSGGAAITAGGTATYDLRIGLVPSGGDTWWVGDTSSLAVGDPVMLARGREYEFPVTRYYDTGLGITDPSYIGAPDKSSLREFLRVGDRVQFEQTNGSGGVLDNVTAYVTSIAAAIDGNYITVSRTVSGSPISPIPNNEQYTMRVSLLPGGDDWWNGLLYVKQIVDGYHVKFSAIPGGSAITASATVIFLGYYNYVDDSLLLRTYPRAYGNLSQPRFFFFRRLDGGFDITFGYDVADSIYIKGMPPGLEFNGSDEITQPDWARAGYYVITIVLQKGTAVSQAQIVLEIYDT